MPDLERLALDSLTDFMPIPRRGIPSHVSMDFVRELTREDLDGLTVGTLAIGTPPLKRLRTAHHNLARLLADGHKAVEVSAITGYTQSRISILQRDPAFQELVSYYSEQAREQFLDVHARLAQVGQMALDEVQERLETEPEQFTNKELLGVVESAFDRSVAPTKGVSKSQSGQSANVPAITINFVSPSDTSPEITLTAEPQR